MPNKEIVSFNAGEMTEKSDALENVEKYQSGCRHLENMLPRIYGSAERRPGTIIPGLTYGVTGLELKRAMYYKPNYAFTYFGDNATVWGVPLNPLTGTTLTLDAGGVAVSYSGGSTTGLPCAGHPFKATQTIRVAGSTNHSGTATVQAGTSANEIIINDAYVAETFDGTETIVLYKGSLTASPGRFVRDLDWNLYLGTNVVTSPITKLSPDFLTVDDDYFSPADNWAGSTTTTGLAITGDGKYLYLWQGGLGLSDHLYKFKISDGSEEWMVHSDGGGSDSSYNIAVDADDNVYVLSAATSADKTFYSMAMFAAADGSKTEHTVSHGVYEIHVDNDMGIILTGYDDWYKPASPSDYYGWNLYKTNIGETIGTGVRLGGLTYVAAGVWTTDTIRTMGIITYDGYIYVLVYNTFDEVNPKVAVPKWQIFKLDSDLNILKQVDAPTSADGIYADGLGHIVAISQSAGTPQTDIFWYYDTDLTFVVKTGGFYNGMFALWNASAIIHGNEVLPNASLAAKY